MTPLSQRFLLLAPALLLLGCETHDRMVYDRDYRPSNMLREAVYNPKAPEIPAGVQTASSTTTLLPSPAGAPVFPPVGAAPALPAAADDPFATAPAGDGAAPASDPFGAPADPVPEGSAPAEPPGF